MFDLPTIWCTSSIKSISPHKVLYGLHVNEEDISYGFYVTNLNDVWLEEVSFSSLIEKATTKGYEGMNHETLRKLLNTLSNIVKEHDLSELVSSSSTNSDLHIQLCSKELNWDFHSKRACPERTSKFFVDLNLQQFQVHNYLQYEVSELKKLVESKDQYLKFLSENLRLLHGSDIIKKYRKIQKPNSSTLEEFNDIKWTKLIKSSYVNKMKDEYLDEDHIWKQTQKSLQIKVPWQTLNELNHSSKKNLVRSKEWSKHTVEKDVMEDTSNISPRRKKPKRIGMMRNRR